MLILHYLLSGWDVFPIVAPNRQLRIRLRGVSIDVQRSWDHPEIHRYSRGISRVRKRVMSAFVAVESQQLAVVKFHCMKVAQSG